MMATYISLIVRWLPHDGATNEKPRLFRSTGVSYSRPPPHTIKTWITQKVLPAMVTRLRR